MKLAGKVVVVTGAASGIGRELAFHLVAKGARVAALDMNQKALGETCDALGSNRQQLQPFVVNVADRSAVQQVAADVVAQMGPVDCVINNAGVIQPFVRVAALSYEALDRVIQVNLYGVLHVTKAFLPTLLQRPEAHLVNVSSMGGFVPVPGQTVYGAAKAAVKLFTEGLASELLHTKVKVSVVCPGAVATNIMQNSGLSLDGLAGDESPKYNPLSPARAAELICRGIEADRRYIFVGRDALFMQAIYRLSPSRASKLIAKKMGELLKP